VVGYLLSVVQEVVGDVVVEVSKDAAAVDGHRCVPVVEEKGVGQLPEGRCQHYKQGRRHDQAEPVHWEVVVDTVQQEVGSDADSVIRKISGIISKRSSADLE